MRFDVLTLFPEIFSGYQTQSLLKLAIERGLVEIHLHNIRDWARGRHREVDDRPFGGGPGMVLKPEPVVECVEEVQQLMTPPGRLLLLTPQGRRLDQQLVEELAGTDPQSTRLTLLCGRYEGFDQRVIDLLEPEEISVGDFVLNGGEVAAMTIIDTVIRLAPGVLGDESSSVEDSFSRARFSGRGRLLEHAQYTRPREYRGLEVPEVLLSGDHPAIAQWRRQNSLEKTKQRRADLLAKPDTPETDETEAR
ncbi:MAG: tRNA (guanosine(37)-N1)-methyltransferase TrmD [Planctomycetota bacterium]